MRNLNALSRNEMLAARKRMMLGASLEEAADHVGLEPGELDLALWGRLARMADAGQVVRIGIPRENLQIDAERGLGRANKRCSIVGGRGGALTPSPALNINGNEASENV